LRQKHWQREKREQQYDASFAHRKVYQIWLESQTPKDPEPEGDTFVDLVLKSFRRRRRRGKHR
jgi:hypothetical protein